MRQTIRPALENGVVDLLPGLPCPLLVLLNFHLLEVLPQLLLAGTTSVNGISDLRLHILVGYLIKLHVLGKPHLAIVRVEKVANLIHHLMPWGWIELLENVRRAFGVFWLY